MTPGARPGRSIGLVLWGAILWVVLEGYAIARVGGWLGALDAGLLLVATSAVGALVLRHGGLVAMRRFFHWGAEAHEKGELPAPEPLLASVPWFVGGALLLAPGFVSDALGLLALVPPGRSIIIAKARRLLREAERHAATAGQGPIVVEGVLVRSRPAGGTAEDEGEGAAIARGALPGPDDASEDAP